MTITNNNPTTPSKTDGPFHILCKEQPDSPNMWVGICVNDTERLAADMEALTAKNPYLLVVAFQGGYETERKLVPLDRGLVHMSFRRAGTFDLYAMIVWDWEGNAADLKRIFMEKCDFGMYKVDMFDYDKQPKQRFWLWRSGRSDLTASRLPFFGTHQIIVPEGNFAKERPKWVEAFVGIFHSNRGWNACKWRGRLLSSIGCFITVLPAHYAAKLVIAIAHIASGLVYGLDLRAVYRPYRHGTLKEVYGSVDRHSFWLYKRMPDGSMLKRSSVLVGVLMYAAALALVSWMVSSGADHTSFGASLLSVFMLSFGIGCGTFVVAVMAQRLFRRRTARNSRLAARTRARQIAREAQLAREREALMQKVATMSCTTQGEPMTIDRLVDRKKLSPAVFGNRVKDRVCLPFQQK